MFQNHPVFFELMVFERAIAVLTVQVLNLKRRVDRRESFAKWNQQPDLELEWVEAVDGQELQMADLVREGLIAENQPHFKAGSVGCALSHRMMWERAVREDRPLVVCEDDAILRGDFPAAVKEMMDRLPAGWDFVTFGYNFDSAIDVELIPGQHLRAGFSNWSLAENEFQAFVGDHRPSLPFPLKNAFGFCAYAISPKGAKQFLECCFPLEGLAVEVPALSKFVSPTANVDEILNAYLDDLSTYCAIPPLAVSPNDPETSDTINSVKAGSQPENPAPVQTPEPSIEKESQELMTRFHGANPYEGFDHTKYRIDLQGTPTDPIFQELLAKLKPRLVVEVGSWKGDSSLHMAFLIKQLQFESVVLSVDTWLGSLEHFDARVQGWDILPYRNHGYSQLYYQFLANVLHHNCQDRIIPLPTTSTNAARWMIRNHITADLIYLDGSHEEDEVYLDLCLYWRILRPGGVLFGDDWAAYWYGVICAVNRFAKEHELNLQVINQKWVLQKPTH